MRNERQRVGFDLSFLQAAPRGVTGKGSCSRAGKMSHSSREIIHADVCVCDVQLLPTATDRGDFADFFFLLLKQTSAMPWPYPARHADTQTPTMKSPGPWANIRYTQTQVAIADKFLKKVLSLPPFCWDRWAEWSQHPVQVWRKCLMGFMVGAARWMALVVGMDVGKCGVGGWGTKGCYGTAEMCGGCWCWDSSWRNLKCYHLMLVWLLPLISVAQGI